MALHAPILFVVQHYTTCPTCTKGNQKQWCKFPSTFLGGHSCLTRLTRICCWHFSSHPQVPCSDQNSLYRKSIRLIENNLQRMFTVSSVFSSFPVKPSTHWIQSPNIEINLSMILKLTVIFLDILWQCHAISPSCQSQSCQIHHSTWTNAYSKCSTVPKRKKKKIRREKKENEIK